MATASVASSVLQTTPGKRNFQRLSRLLIAGGTSVLREVLDYIRPPQILRNILAVKDVREHLRAELTYQQWLCVYPAPGCYANSSNFDITLLFCLFREICGRRSPPSGWDQLPGIADQTVSADLARVKFYRNTIYAHDRGDMEMNDDRFNCLWAEISGALTRLAYYVSDERGLEWKQAIANLQNAPLTPEDEHVRELNEWYRINLVTKEMVEREYEMTRQTVSEESEQTRETTGQMEENIHQLEEEMRQLKENLRDMVEREHEMTRQTVTSEQVIERMDRLEGVLT